MIRKPVGIKAKAAFAALLAAAGVTLGGAVRAQPVSYTLDPSHTYPSFEADHLGISVWRGKFDKSRGKVTLDKAAGQGSVAVDVDLASVDFGQKQLNAWARGKEFFNVAKFPSAHYTGRFTDFVDGAPTRVVGELRLHGVTQPVALKILSFKCIQHPLLKREYCGADALGSFDRSAFGLDAGKDYGFKMDVTLRIQAEAIADK